MSKNNGSSRIVRSIQYVSFLILMSITSLVHASFIGQSINVTFTELGYADVVDSVFPSTISTEISFGDGTNIGDVIMLDGEFIDFTEDSIILNIRGDGPAHSTSGYQTTGFTSGASYLFTGFDMNVASVIFSLDDIVGVDFGSELTYGSDFIQLDISTLGVKQIIGSADLGSITLNVDFAVPLPASLPLMIFGLAGILSFMRKPARLNN